MSWPFYGSIPTTHTTPINKLLGLSKYSVTLNSAIYISLDVRSRKVAYLGSTTEDIERTRATVPSNVNLALDSWHSVHVEVAMTDIAVSINGGLVPKFTQHVKFYGFYGLGASFRHKARYF